MTATTHQQAKPTTQVAAVLTQPDGITVLSVLAVFPNQATAVSTTPGAGLGPILAAYDERIVEYGVTPDGLPYAELGGGLRIRLVPEWAAWAGVAL